MYSSLPYTERTHTSFKGKYKDVGSHHRVLLGSVRGHCTGDRDQDHPHGKEMQKSKMAVWGGLTNSCEKKRSEKQRRKGKI